VGRRSELAAIQQLLSDRAADVRALLLEGAPGIGKTTLWEAGCQLAAEAGYRVLTCRPAEPETGFAYAAVQDLFEDRDDVIAALPKLQRDALDAALLRTESQHASPDQRAVALAVRSVLQAIGEAGPFVVAVDDVQWLDRPSARALAFALRRLVGSQVRVLTSLRLAPGLSDPLNLPALGADQCVRLRLATMSDEAIGEVIRQALGRSLRSATRNRVYAAANGNPYYAIEIVRALGDSEPEPGEALPVPDDLSSVLRARLSRLTPETRNVLLLAAAMARPTLHAAATAVGSTDVLESALAEAEAASIAWGEGEYVRFVHPLMISTIYQSASASARRRAHARLAEASTDIEERARHLALATLDADPAVAAVLEEAAVHARLRGAPIAAAELFERGAQLTPETDADQRRRLGTLAAMYTFDSGDPALARTRLAELLLRASPGPERAHIGFELSTICWNDYGRCRDLLEAAIEDGEADANTLSRALSDRAYVEIGAGTLEAACDYAIRAGALAEGLADPFPLRHASCVLAHTLTLMGRDEEAAQALSRARSLMDYVRPAELEEPQSLTGRHLMWAGDLESGRAHLSTSLRRYETEGHELLKWETLLFLAELECLAGDWAEAARLAEESHEIVTEAGWLEVLDDVLSVRALVRALIGDVDGATTDATDALRRAKEQQAWWSAMKSRAVLGFLALSLGEHARAVEILRPVPDRLGTIGIREPGAFPCIPDLVESLVAIRELESAKALTAQLEEQGRALDRPLALATAARSTALISAALGDPDGALLSFARAFEQHERLSMPFELARTQLVHGEVLRRLKKKSPGRQALEAAVHAFDELGAPLWAQRARAGLSRLGGRPSTTELSPTERQVADRVAEGLTNKEVADQLFISAKTVEANLRRIYQKLGVRSRTELAARFRDDRVNRQS
jgi:DNA-binding NarL/FixJ family response regulator